MQDGGRSFKSSLDYVAHYTRTQTSSPLHQLPVQRESDTRNILSKIFDGKGSQPKGRVEKKYDLMRAEEDNTEVTIASGLALQKGFYLFAKPEGVEQAAERETLLVHGDPVLLGSGPGSLRYTRLGYRAGMHPAKDQVEADKKYTATVNSGWHLLKFEKRDRDSPVPSPWMATVGGSSGSGTGASRSTVAGQWGQRSGAAVLSHGLGDDGSEQQVKEEAEATRVTGAVSYTCLK